MAQLPVPSNPQSEISDAETARYVTDADLFSEATFESRRSSVANPLPNVTSYTPRSGRAGFNVFVTIESLFDVYSVPSTPSTVFSVLFASKRCSCTMEVLEPSGGHFNYVLAVEIPQFGQTSWHSLSVPLRLLMEVEGQNSQSVALGSFTYDEVPSTSPEQSSRKRKASEDSEIAQQPTKKVSTQSLSIKQNQEAFAYNQQISTSPYSPFLPTPTSGNMYNTVKTPQMSSPNPMIRQSSGISNPSQAAMRIPSPQTPSWSPPYSSVNRPVRSPALPVTTARHTAVATQSNLANPPLIRTSTIQQPPSSVNLSMAPQPGQSFNPYAMYPHKAVLKLNGNLDSMVEDWTPKEWEAKRRLVQFTRRQNGSTIRADFKPVTPEERPPNSICISCIYWEGKNECFVTSVDTIYLLESLVAVRFTVEEKNRIRRNLEGFRPLTVSKAKADSEDFFKVIMGFPNPKPRNIEKDVKVFPWKILSHALKKIIGKYVSFLLSDDEMAQLTGQVQSASYSSTAGSLVTPVSSTYATGGMPDDHHLGHRNPSPQLMPDPSNPNVYASSLTPTTSPGMMSEYQSNSIASMSYPYASAPAPAYSYQPMRPHNGMPGPMSAPVPRGAWGYEHFGNPGLGPAALPATTQQGYYAPPVTYASGNPTSGI